MISSSIKGVIILGGNGYDSLRSLFMNTPLPQVPIGGQKILNYQINDLINSGVDDIILFGSYEESQIKSYCKSASDEHHIKFEYFCF